MLWHNQLLAVNLTVQILTKK